ncbi:MFS transporter [Luteipulveratus sp. YIM 133132]|uniref:MFS transporter n=1 Tax=Luteipulveratus flavus TaxID=3031728 RepID=A0ABT6C6J2_9MICO|nr:MULTISPECIES: MFS transporter [unclassified Luteipulveratus]MDE9365162.1 MFS transporter [Luteipulveratus sp. YIM 133132]MDF8264502.1 MFS transporter [Luteipulveratus sp. YIM 133296]
MSEVGESAGLRMNEKRGRLLLLTTILGSGMAFLDGTIVNVALPRIGKELQADLAGLQWVVNGYTLTLASLILVGGSLGDRLGRKRVYGWGVAGFAVMSVLCALAPTIEILVASRLLQGVAAALLTPGSLAMLQASFHPDDRMRAIGAWTGMLGIATAGGPVVGGWLVGIEWRLAFWLNVPLAAIVLLLLRSAPESRDEEASHHTDLAGVLLAPIGLAGITWALTAWPDTGASVSTLLSLAVGVLACVAFVVAERRERDPMVPLSLFANRTFSVINLVTLVVYGALSGSMFFIAVFLQVSAGWSPLAAGAATVPMSVIMLFLASRFGGIASTYGARTPMLAGSVLIAAALALLALAPDDPSFWRHILPGVTLMGFGLSMLVAPLTGTVLAAAPPSRSGLASGINNAISRTAGLLAIAVLPLLVGLSGREYAQGHLVADAYRQAMWWCAALVLAGTVVTAFGLERHCNRQMAEPATEGSPA